MIKPLIQKQFDSIKKQVLEERQRILGIIDKRIIKFKKVVEENDEEYIKLNDFGLGFTGEKMTKKQKDKNLEEIKNGTIFVSGKIEVLQEIKKAIGGIDATG